MGQTNLRKTNANIENYVKNKWEKIMEREQFHYYKDDDNGVLWRARISGIHSSSPSA